MKYFYESYSAFENCPQFEDDLEKDGKRPQVEDNFENIFLYSMGT